ncbi:PTS ascorbate transporter subunit IIC [Tetragenococcus halophilus]|uniref:Ascorbate-specific PTS system EIIC component n=1 Tax=Tetragenococcus halophilus TaxID=51669 RepID=A0AB35HLB7_TETHA|nr:PTS ascorbate transporter subunit IIC [Tetragenococcus halophilus]MCF1686187.1 PTS transporter subunit IIC [Tetragenococcus halophilus]MCO8297082.1 PTS transporter subunit IIC [Tetragenococcus halophilus]
MEFLRVIVFDLLSSAPILVGVIALTGLLLQKESFDKVISGTLKTIVGFLVFGVGSAAATEALDSFQKLFAEGFGLTGVLPLAEAVTALAQDHFGTTVSLVMLIGFLCNLIIAKITPLKYIFLTGQHNLYLAALLTIMFKSLNMGNVFTIAVGGLILGVSSSLFPAIAQPYMRKVTGDEDIAMGHYVTVGYAISGWIGSKIGKPEDSTEKVKLPKWLSMFKDYVVGVSITMVIFFYVAAIAAGKGTVEELSGGVNWLVYPLFQGLSFSAALYVIITGVRLFLGEIVSAFVGISEKLIPNAKPALDCPVVFPFAPTATVIGFLAAYMGGLVAMVVMGLLGTLVIIPVAVPYFFIGATAGVFGNATGGWKGCIAGSFVVGILIAVGPALIYPIMENIGMTGTSFPETDFNIVGLLIYYIGQFLQTIF